MNLLLPALLLAVPAVVGAQEAVPAPDPPRRIPALAVLPSGGVLKSLMLPRYDAKRTLLEVLRAEELTIEDEGRVSGKKVSVEFFNADGGKRGRVDLSRALFDEKNGVVTAEGGVRARFERLLATGTGLIYEFENGEGFVTGPATTVIEAPIETAMKRPSIPFRAVAFIGISALSAAEEDHSAHFATAEELAIIDSKSAPLGPQAAAAVASTEATMAEALAKSEKASSAAAAFVARRSILIAAGEEPAAGPAVAESELPEMVAGPDHTLITSDDGFYFNSEQGVLVYLENVKVTDPRFDVFGNVKELKVFLGKKPEEAAGQDGGKKKNVLGGAGAGFGEIERILANGAIRIRQKGVDPKESIEASGAIFSYNMKDEEIILRGGKPWVKRGGSIVRAVTPDQTVKISRNGDFSFSGKTETRIALKELER